MRASNQVAARKSSTVLWEANEDLSMLGVVQGRKSVQMLDGSLGEKVKVVVACEEVMVVWVRGGPNTGRKVKAFGCFCDFYLD